MSFLFVWKTGPAADITANEASSPGADHIDQTICRFLEEQGVPGATLAVAKDGRIVYEQGKRFVLSWELGRASQTSDYTDDVLASCFEFSHET